MESRLCRVARAAIRNTHSGGLSEWSRRRAPMERAIYRRHLAHIPPANADSTIRRVHGGAMLRLERIVEVLDVGIPVLARDIRRTLLKQTAHLTDRIAAVITRIGVLSVRYRHMNWRLTEARRQLPNESRFIHIPIPERRRGRTSAPTCHAPPHDPPRNFRSRIRAIRSSPDWRRLLPEVSSSPWACR